MPKEEEATSVGASRPTLQIVIVNWKSGKLLHECLESIYASSASSFILEKITVVDNDSSDESIDGMHDAHIPTEVISPGGNIGFGAACNLGADQSESDMILFLNPDTLVEARSLDSAVQGFLGFDEGRLAALGVQLFNQQGQLERTCSRLPTTATMLSRSLGLSKVFPSVFRGQYMLDWDHERTRIVEQVMGAFILVRRCTFVNIGCFDEQYFVYFEEVDYCRVASDRGYDVVYLASASITHQGGGASQRVRSTRLFYSLRSRLQYFKKHHRLLSFWLVVLSTTLAEPWIRCLASIARGRFAELPEVVSAYRRLYWTLLSRNGWAIE